ncbi:Zinc-finger domain-containing protein [Frankia sp. AiPs1]|uniref:hypothetical protein n=1 Tax=Frankia sp. AiPa1 TaxID=573492 RepID=UPI00202B0B5A|nr:hypothetical protein [Frankia sp. AiPa1]MCL9760699.1 hypothetical protein [Frankia sp. AiPa1]
MGATDPHDDQPRATQGRPAFSLGSRSLSRRGRGPLRHPDVEMLDAAAGGEPVARSTREHIEACPVCRESVAALRRVRSELSRLATMTMPGDVAERIQAALATRVTAASDAARPPSEASESIPPASTAPRSAQAPRPSAEPGPAPSSGSAPEHASTAEAATTSPPASPSAPPSQPTVAPAPASAEASTVPRSSTAPSPASASGPTAPSGVDLPRPTPPSDGLRHPAREQRPGPARRTKSASRPVFGRSGSRRRASLARPRPGSRRPDRGAVSEGDPGSGGRDWVSIAAVCVAFLTFGAALFALHDLRSGVATSTIPKGQAARAAQVGRSAASSMTMMADSRAALAPANIVRHGDALLDGGITGSMALSLGLAGTPVVGAAAPVSTAAGRQSVAADRAQPTARGSAAAEVAASAGVAEPARVATEVRAFTRAAAAGRLRALLDTPDLRTCYQSLLAQTGGSILGVDLVNYDSQPAVLIVLSVPSQPSSARLLVVDSACGMTSSSTAPLYNVIAQRG